MYIIDDVNVLKKNIGIGILASEKSRRMNTNKAFLKIGDISFIDKLIDEFNDYGEIIISSSSEDTYKNLNVRVVEDMHDGVGPMEGILQILNESKNEYNFICSVDMPFLKKDLLDYLVGQISNDFDCYVFIDEKRAHPTCSIYSKNLAPLIYKLIEQKKYCLLEIFEKSRTKYIKFPNEVLDKKIISNINTQQDYEKLCKS